MVRGLNVAHLSDSYRSVCQYSSVEVALNLHESEVALVTLCGELKPS